MQGSSREGGSVPVRRHGASTDVSHFVDRCRIAATVLLALSCGSLCSCGTLWASTPMEATTSREAREEAIRAIPLEKLNQNVRGKLWGVIADASIYRCMPIQVTECDPDLYVFLVRHPEIVVNMWELMGVTNIKLSRTGPYTFNASDGAGTVSSVELVYGSRNLHVMYAEGSYEGPLLKRRITGQCVLVLSNGYVTDDHDRELVSSRLDVFLRLDQVGVELVAKTLHPLFGKTADENFGESTKFLSKVSQVARTNGAGIQRLVPQLEKVDPEVRDEFAQIAAAIGQKAARRGGSSPAPQLPDRVGHELGHESALSPSDLSPSNPARQVNATDHSLPVLPPNRSPTFRR